MQFIRLIIHGPEHAFFNMALDEAVAEAVRGKLSPPTLRLYQWKRPSISVGYFQKSSEVNLDYCSERGYPVVRRLTGGRAILHDDELTYSVSSCADSALFRGGLHETYRTISSALVSALCSHGINAQISFRKKRNIHDKNPSCFRSASYGEITVNGKKIIGSAQKRYKDGFLQHGSLLLGHKADELNNVLNNIGPDSGTHIGSLTEYSPGMTADRLCRSLREAFEKVLNVKLVTDIPTKAEMKAAETLVTAKYSSDKWNLMR